MKHFKESEFDWSGDTFKGVYYPAIKAVDVYKPETLELFDKARELSGIAWRVTSGARPRLWDALKHGVDYSDHAMATGADIKYNEAKMMQFYIENLQKIGIRFGAGTGRSNFNYFKQKADSLLINNIDGLKIVGAALLVGFTRIGINYGNGHIHLSVSNPHKADNVLWLE